MFFAPSFEPHSPIQPQWFPHPHTQSSQLDQLEHLEEDRKRRLRSIANVAAKTPIGLTDGTAGATNPASAAANPRQNAYSQHRYYPPPSEESVALFHQHQHERRTNNPPSVASSGRRRYRNVRANRSSLHSAASEAHSAQPSEGNNLSHLSHSHISHDANAHSRTSLDSFQESFGVSSPLFHSPPLDPRGGGGGGGGRRNNNDWYASRLNRSRAAQQSYFDASETITPTNAGFESGVGAQLFDMTTPEDAGVTNTPGHGHSEDVYSQRQRRGQRRRRMDS